MALPMKLILTLDYELYFGDDPGTVKQCLIEPAEALRRMAARHGIPMVFFVDCGFLWRLKAEKDSHPALAADYRAVTDQLQSLSREGHELQLHIHPHWEDTRWDGTRWRMDVKRYRLTGFPPDRIHDIVRRYRGVLQEVAGNPVNVYRAGGWCLQPFSALKDALAGNGIVADSSVFRNGRFWSEQYDYDFRGAPDKGVYRFADDPVTEVEEGRFTEFPIASMRVFPLFYWWLFLLGRLDPARHKPLAAGRAMAAPGYRFRLLTRMTRQCVGFDGYNARLMPGALRRAVRKGHSHMVVLGHPKAMSRYSFDALDRFIGRACTSHRFVTFTQELTP